jgi:hypothetical protein
MIAEPVLWQRIHCTRKEFVACVAIALTVSFARGTNVGSCIRHLSFSPGVILKIKKNTTLLNNVLVVLSHASNLVRLEMQPDLQHSMLLALRNTASVRTLTELCVAFPPEALDAIAYIDEFKSLTFLDVEFPTANFQRPSECKPWDLRHLKTLKCLPFADEQAQCCQYFIDCNFPVLDSLQLRLGYITDVEHLSQLYLSKASSLKEFFVYLKDEHYAAVLPHLTGIERLIVEYGSPFLVPALPASVSDLRLRCRSMEHVTNLYGVLDLLSDGRDCSVKIVRVEIIGSMGFQWMSNDEDKLLGDGTIERADLKEKLIQYMSKGLVILDKHDKSLLDYIPWR